MKLVKKISYKNIFYNFMEQEILQKLDLLEKKLEENMKIVRQMRKYFLWMLIVSVVAIVFPLIGLLFVIPKFISSYTNLGF